jgi:serine/threonine protein kinase
VQQEGGEEMQMWSLPWSTRLIDFGLSKRYGQDHGGLNATCTIDTHSIAWMAPETFASSQHLQASDVYSLGMVLWEVMTLSMPPTARIATYVASGQAFVGASCASPGPCEEQLAELLALDASGDDAALVRKCHGVACPVLEPLVKIIRSTHRYFPADRLTAAQVACELGKLEKLCLGLPPRRVPTTGEHMLGYWRASGSLAESSIETFRTFSEEDEEEEEERRLAAQGAAWTKVIARVDSIE